MNAPHGWPKTGEDKLLAHHRANVPMGSMYLEVGIGGTRSLWKGSSQRRIDGVIVRPGPAGSVLGKKQFSADWKAGHAWESADLLEAKAGLSEGVIGQLLAAKPMFEKHREVAVRELVALYRHVDPAMVWAAGELGIKLYRVPRSDGKNNPMRSRPQYRLSGKKIGRALRYREQEAGSYITRVPIAGSYGSAPRWPDSRETYVEFVRLPSAKTGPIMVFEDAAWFGRKIEGSTPEIVVVRKSLGRGAIGVARVHALLFAERYGVLPTSTIVCEEGDAALEWVCREGLSDERRIRVVKVDAIRGVDEDEGDEEEEDA